MGEREQGFLTNSSIFDTFIGPLAPGSVMFIAAFSGIGKTAFAMHVSSKAVLRSAIPVFCAAPKGSAVNLIELLCETSIWADGSWDPNNSRQRLDFISNDSDNHLISRRTETEIEICVDESLSIEDTIDRTKQFFRGRAGLLVVDGLEKLRVPKGLRGSWRENANLAVAALKDFALQSECGVIATICLDRPKTTKTREPRPNDLHKLALAESCADTIVLLDRSMDDLEAERDDRPDPGVLEAQIIKRAQGIQKQWIKFGIDRKSGMMCDYYEADSAWNAADEEPLEILGDREISRIIGEGLYTIHGEEDPDEDVSKDQEERDDSEQIWDEEPIDRTKFESDGVVMSLDDRPVFFQIKQPGFNIREMYYIEPCVMVIQNPSEPTKYECFQTDTPDEWTTLVNRHAVMDYETAHEFYEMALRKGLWKKSAHISYCSDRAYPTFILRVQDAETGEIKSFDNIMCGGYSWCGYQRMMPKLLKWVEDHDDGKYVAAEWEETPFYATAWKYIHASDDR